MNASTLSNNLVVKRIRHPLKARLLTVAKTEKITPYMQRITLTGDSLNDFVSSSFDDHVKLFFPTSDSEVPILPIISDDGPKMPEGSPPPITRDYTPRGFNTSRCELVLDFVLHENGFAANWAKNAEPGDKLGVAGPRGSFVIPHEFDHHILIGDETALPAISRRLEELPKNSSVKVIIEVVNDEAKLKLKENSNTEIVWVNSGISSLQELKANTTSPLYNRVKNMPLPSGELFVWVAAEYSVVKSIREYFVNILGINKERIRASSYWRK